MATFSTFLGLKIPSGTDPFQLSDFALNWGIIDASPGVFACTSGSRPSWGSGQAGRVIFMTDYRQFSWWNGSTWLDPEDSVPVLAGGAALSQSIGKSTAASNTLVTLTLSRPCSLAIMLTGTYSCISATLEYQDLNQKILVDGSALLLGGYSDDHNFSMPSQNTFVNTIPSLGIAQGLAAGSHTIGVQSIVGAQNVSVTLVGAKVIAFITQYNSSNAM